MKEVTICFSFSLKDGVTRTYTEVLAILNGWFGVGALGIEKHKYALENASKLLAQVAKGDSVLQIESITLRERCEANKPDDLEAKNNTHAKSDIVPDDHRNHYRGEF